MGLEHCFHMRRAFIPVLAAIGLAGCATETATTPERSALLRDTGGVMTEGVAAYDVDHYVLRHEILPEEKAIAGSSTIHFIAKRPMETLELDFDGLFAIDAIEASGAPLAYSKTPEKLYITLPETMTPGDEGAVTVHYHGQPMEAKRAPWDGGFVWAKTPSGKPWIATAIQGEGCDVWYPCKDHPLGEPKNGFDLYFTVPAGLTAASNGVLYDVDELEDGRRTFHWRTQVSTNIYGVALNVAPYVLFESEYKSSNGTMTPLMFWAIEDHEEKARVLFDKEFPAIMEFFERHLGPYPWGQEKMGVAETPHLGMEHQTINAYGNEFRRDRFGFDWLLHHEFAHEWFGNLMSVSNNADMWLHEGTAAYMGPVFVKEVLGDAAADAQRYQTYFGIANCAAVAPRGEMSEEEVYQAEKGGPGGDIYGKGAWVLHSLRYAIGDDAFWTSIRRLLYDTDEPSKLKAPIEARFRTTDDFLAIVNDVTGKDYGWFFEVYLRQPHLPEISIRKNGSDIALSWVTPDDLPFPMPIPVSVNGSLKRIDMKDGKAVIKNGGSAKVQIDPMMSVLRQLHTSPTCEERQAAQAH